MPPNLKRGQRDARDIIEAAEDQGWVRKPGGRNNSHIYLVPPDGGVPVGVSSSPSDVHFRHQIIRQMRKSGFVWPPPKKIKIKNEEDEVLTEVIDAAVDQGWTVDRENKAVTFIPPGTNKPQVKLDAKGEGIGFHDLRNLKRIGLVWPWTPPIRPQEQEPDVQHEDLDKLVTEVWRQMDWNDEYELSNAGRCRKIDTGKMIYPDGAGMLSLNHRGRRQTKHLKGLVISHFGHPPLKNVALTDEVMGHRTAEIKAVMEEPDLTPEVGEDNQEKNEVTAQPVLDIDITSTELEDGWAWIKSVPEAIDGYSVSILGEIRRPDGGTQNVQKIGNQMWVQLKRFDEPGKRRAVRVDKLMLATFAPEQLAPFKGAAPTHKDGDGTNCAIDNLAWPDPFEEAEEPPVPHVVPDEVSEPIEPEPPVDAEEGRVGATIVAEVVAEVEEAEKSYEHQEYVDRVVDEAPSFSHPGKTVGEVKAMEAEEAIRTEVKPRKPRKSRAKVKVAPKEPPAPTRGIITQTTTYELDGIQVVRLANGNYQFGGVEFEADTAGVVSSLIAEVAQYNELILGIKQ